MKNKIKYSKMDGVIEEVWYGGSIITSQESYNQICYTKEALIVNKLLSLILYSGI